MRGRYQPDLQRGKLTLGILAMQFRERIYQTILGARAPDKGVAAID